MANYQRPLNSTLNHPGENNAGAQSTGTSHPAQHIQAEMDHTTAHPLSSHTPAANAANAADQAAGARSIGSHSAIVTNSNHTCATCKVICRNNFALEKHASKERHKSFMCTCTTGFVRLATLNRHIAAQAGPKYYCDYCDDNKGFAREDKLVDHLRGSHKFGNKVIARIRSQTRVQPDGKGDASSAAATTGIALPVLTSTGYDAVPGGLVDQAGYPACLSTGPAGIIDFGLADFPAFSTADVQPFGAVQDCPSFDGAQSFNEFDFSGINLTGFEFTGFDENMDMFGMDSSI